MRLRFSRTADYGLRAALEVARAPAGALVPRRRIAEAVHAPPAVLAQALAPLVRAGHLVAQTGPKGGYRLARSAADTSVYQIVIAIDAEGAQRCVLHERACGAQVPCPFHAFLAAAQERFVDALRATSLADVLANAPALTFTGGTEPAP
jgi:Rrf2 family protein